MPNNPPIQPWQTIDSKIVHSTPWIEIVEDKCLVDGHEVTYTYTKRIDEGPLIIAVDNDDKIWLVKQYRHPIKKIIWQFPVEGKSSSETWEAAAQRGLAEELNLEAKTWQDLGQFYPDPGGLEQKYRVYIATDLKEIDAKFSHHKDEAENLEIASFSRAEIDQLINSGEICDNWTLAGLFLYDRYLS